MDYKVGFIFKHKTNVMKDFNQRVFLSERDILGWSLLIKQQKYSFSCSKHNMDLTQIIIDRNPMDPQQQIPPPSYRLTTRNLFNHFLLVHDFLYKFSRTPAPDSHYFDAQIDVQNIMNSATSNGGRFGQFFTLGALVVYCLRSRHIGRKLLFGFLYGYWANHFYTLGTYLGALTRMPSAYRRVGKYYEQSTGARPNTLDKFEQIMRTEQNYEDTQVILVELFQEKKQYKDDAFIENDFFVKNREKYLGKETPQSHLLALRLPYFDSFLTRYVYHSFARWFHRLQLLLGTRSE